MPAALTYPLNPMDNMILAINESLRNEGYCGFNVMLIADLVGSLPSASLADAVRRLSLHYPALSARIRLSPLTRRAHWHVPGDAQLEAGIEYVHRKITKGDLEDLTLLRRLLGDTIDPASTSQVRLLHLETSDNHHRLALRWPHQLMDVEGAHLLFRSLHQILLRESPTLEPDPAAAAKPPYPGFSPRFLYRLLQGHWHHTHCRTLRQPRVVKKPDDGRKTLNLQWRRHGAEFRDQFREVARRRTQPGPMRYVRAMIIALARTYFELATERGRPRDHFIFPYPAPVPRNGHRPRLHGNYVMISWVIFSKSDLQSYRSADASAFRQISSYRAQHQDEACWNMLSALRWWPFSFARFVASHSLPRGAAGCSSYRFGDSITQIGTAKITNFVPIGTVSCHPGWIIGESTYGENMNITITFFENFFTLEDADEILDRLEYKLLGRDE